MKMMKKLLIPAIMMVGMAGTPVKAALNPFELLAQIGPIMTNINKLVQEGQGMYTTISTQVGAIIDKFNTFSATPGVINKIELVSNVVTKEVPPILDSITKALSTAVAPLLKNVSDVISAFDANVGTTISNISGELSRIDGTLRQIFHGS